MKNDSTSTRQVCRQSLPFASALHDLPSLLLRNHALVKPRGWYRIASTPFCVVMGTTKHMAPFGDVSQYHAVLSYIPASPRHPTPKCAPQTLEEKVGSDVARLSRLCVQSKGLASCADVSPPLQPSSSLTHSVLSNRASDNFSTADLLVKKATSRRINVSCMMHSG